MYRTAVADPDETAGVAPTGVDGAPTGVAGAPTGVVPVEADGPVAGADAQPEPAFADVEEPPEGSDAAGRTISPAVADVAVAVELEASSSADAGGRWLIASSGAARRSEKQYRHLIASSWIISAQ